MTRLLKAIQESGFRQNNDLTENLPVKSPWKVLKS